MKIKYTHIILAFFILTATFSCNKTSKDTTDREETAHIDRQSEEDFELFYIQFIEDFNLKNTRHLNRYIDVDNGLITIANEGTYGLPRKFKNFAEFMEFKGDGETNYIRKAKITTPLKYGAKPIFDCTKQAWNNEGCFWNDKPNPDFSSLYYVLMEHKIIEHDQIVQENIKTIDMLVTRIVYDTENNMGFYFNRMNGKWYLLCIERILPCGK